MIISLPTVEYVIKDEVTLDLEKIEGSIKVHIDTSFKSYLKWDKLFKEEYGKDLPTFSTEMKQKTSVVKNDPSKINGEYIDGALKILYCFIDDKDLPTYEEFVELLDISTMQTIIERLATVLSQVGKTAGKN